MATGVKSAPPAPKQRLSASKAPAPAPPPHQMGAIRATLLVILAFCAVGVIPFGIIVKASGLQVALPSRLPLFASSAPTPTDAPDLALPRDAWVAQSVDVLPRPAAGIALATLAPAFPVTLTQHQRVDQTIWSRIEWKGPVAGAGGTGWVPDGSLISYGNTGAIVGDLGALAPTLRAAVSSYRTQFSAVVYIPSQNRFYATDGPDATFALGTGIRPMLLSALYAGAAAQKKSVSLTDALAVSHGDANGTLRVFQQLGGASGLTLYLSGHDITGVATAPTWNACTTTPRALATFYTHLADNLLAASDRSSVISILSLADATMTTNLVAPWARAAGNLLVVGSAPTGSTFTVSVAGILAPAHGPQLIVVAVATDQSTTDAALSAMKSFYSELTALFAT